MTGLETGGGVAARNPPKLGQKIWRWFCRGVLLTHYRRSEVDGLENLPPEGGVLLCANHPSALVDGVVIQAMCPRLIHPLARSGLFTHPLLRPMLALMQAVPVYRREDAGGDTRRNVDVFERCYEILGRGGVLLIFPEGQSHSDPGLRALKTGAARLALGALERNGRAPVVLPVGLNFTDVGRFRNSLLIKFGKPVEVVALEGEAPEEAALRTTEAIRVALSGVTLNLESWEDFEFLRQVERFFSLRRGKYRKRALSTRFRALQNLQRAGARLREQAPHLMERLAQRLRQFENLCRRFGVRDYHLTVSYTPILVTRFIARGLTIIFLALPLAVYGWLNAALPYYLTGLLALRSATDRYQYDTAKICYGMLFFGLFWGGQTAAVAWLLGAIPAVAYALSLIPTAAIAFYLRRERERILDNIRVFFLFLRRRDLRQLLEFERAELERDLAGLTKLAGRSAVSS